MWGFSIQFCSQEITIHHLNHPTSTSEKSLPRFRRELHLPSTLQLHRQSHLGTKNRDSKIKIQKKGPVNALRYIGFIL